MKAKKNALRPIGKIVSSQHKRKGLLPVRTPFTGGRLKEIDPFLLLEHIGPACAKNVVDSCTEGQPYKGFEMLTYLLEGYMEYGDYQGNYGTLQAGDLQWITAGRGIMHAENPEKSFAQRGGNIQAVHLWINLPRSKKLLAPGYQNICSFQLPTISLEKVMIRILAGEWEGEASPVVTQVPVLIMHLMLEAGATIEISIPPSFHAGIYVLQNYGLFGEEEMDVEEGNLIVFNIPGEVIRIKSPEGRPLQVLLVSGEPIGEHIVSYGPFVMNTADEVSEAMTEYTNGQMGSLSF